MGSNPATPTIFPFAALAESKQLPESIPAIPNLQQAVLTENTRRNAGAEAAFRRVIETLASGEETLAFGLGPLRQIDEAERK